MNILYDVDEISVPVIPLRGIWAFPHNLIHFDVGRAKSVKAIEVAQKSDSKLIFLVTQKDHMVEDPTIKDCYEMGTLVEIRDVYQLQEGGLRVLVSGICRAEVKAEIKNEDYLLWSVKTYSFNESEFKITKEVVDEISYVKSLLTKYAELHPLIPNNISLGLNEEEINIEVLTDKIAAMLHITPDAISKILIETDPLERLHLIKKALYKELYLLQLEDKINVRVRNQMNQNQKEYYLKEKIKAIEDELGEGEDTRAEIEELKKKIFEKKMSKEATDKALQELNRLRKNTYNFAEAGIIRNYIDWLLDLPWSESSEDETDIKFAKEVLDKDHYGLDDVKERIIEYLAVKQFNPSTKGNILLFVGPPGVGKTSIAKSIAEALNRPFVRMSLGGITDEAEIRGHRRTYVGALPGRIIAGMKKAGKNNPVFLLDEIDKINSDFRGDPASALLEVLDPEQNKDFKDNYLDVSFDLSKVLFLTTANSLNIPPALLDRMEVIHISGYTDDEKMNIASKYLVKKQMKNSGVTGKEFKLNKSALKEIIEYYTRESGVRELERSIDKIVRKAVVKLVKKEADKIVVNKKDIEEYLGPRKYTFDLTDKKDRIGVANGLAWTSVGGTTLQVETIVSPGSGKVKLTGKLGDVMKESAIAAVSYIRSNTKELGVDKDFYKKFDIHVHVPEGAVPKDGPSAGITIATSILSALTNKPIDRFVAMTGELTLTGRVLAIGGLKSKVLAAQRMGIKKVIVPYENQKDMVEIPDNAKEDLQFIFVKNISEVFSNAIR